MGGPEPYIGQIVMFGGNFAPRGWALCDGQLLPIANYNALFSILGTTYGGDGRTTFALPDLRGRIPMHPGTGPGLSPRSLGEKAGAEQVTLTSDEMPVHNHNAVVNTNIEESNLSIPKDSTIIGKSGSGDPDFTTGEPNNRLRGDAVSVENAGGGLPHPNVQPFQCVNFIIALQGIFPPRS